MVRLKHASNVLATQTVPRFFAVDRRRGAALRPPVDRLGNACRLYARSLSGMQKEAFIASARSGTTWRVTSDEGDYLAGFDEAPCPLSFFTTGMVCAYFAEILSLADQRDVRFGELRLVQDNFYTMKGAATKGTMTGGARNVELAVHVVSDADDAALNSLIQDAVLAAPIHGLLQDAKESLFSLVHNNRRIATNQQLDAANLVFPDTLNQLVPMDGVWEQLIRRGELTPKREHTVTLANDSLADEQSRILHIQGDCRQRVDGLMQVEQRLFNPHGSIFHYLCDETTEFGRGGKAPDATTYLSAGIALCFMTQLGRYAAITRKALNDYHIIQDTHFTRSGRLIEDRTEGDADSVETHVFLQSDEDDEFAQQSLLMSEQTCFLHAFCRTPLETHIKLHRHASAESLAGTID